MLNTNCDLGYGNLSGLQINSTLLIQIEWLSYFKWNVSAMGLVDQIITMRKTPHFYYKGFTDAVIYWPDFVLIGISLVTIIGRP